MKRIYSMSSARNGKKVAAMLFAFLFGFATAHAAVLASETFDADMSDWQDRDGGEMNVVHSAGEGDNAPGSLAGTFAQQGILAPETDAFSATQADNSSGGAFSGDYYTMYTNFTSLTFSFQPEDVLPSDAIVRISDGTYTFFRSFAAQVTTVGAWNPVSISLSYSGWVGGTAGEFASVFNNVTFLDIQITRNGTNSQTYYLDDVALNYDEVNPGGGAVPEAEAGMVFLFGATMIYAFRRHIQFIIHDAELSDDARAA